MQRDLPVFTINRTFDAPRELVYKAWTTPAMLTQWFGPKGSTCDILKHELRPGGIVHSRMEMPGAPTIYGKFVFQEIKANEKLVWLHSFSDVGGVNLTRHPLSPEWPLELLTTVIFKDNGKKTDITLTWTPVNAKPNEIAAFREAMPGMNQGWGGSFETLDGYLNKEKAA